MRPVHTLLQQEVLEPAEATSGRGSRASLPDGIAGWNWGAFLLSWFWGQGNNTLLAWLCFVPGIGMFMPFVLGAMGNEWAWRNKWWASVDEFKRVQRLWAIAGFVVAGLCVAFVGAVVGLSMAESSGHPPADTDRVSLKRPFPPKAPPAEPPALEEVPVNPVE